MKMADARARTRFATISPDPRPDTVTAQGGNLPRRRAFSILDRTSAPGASRPDTLAAQGGILPRRRAVSIPDRPSAQGARSCDLKNETAFKDICSAALAKCSSCETCWEGIELHRQAHNFYETQAALRTKHLCACFAYTSYHVGQQLTHIPNLLHNALECFLLAELYFGNSHPPLAVHAALVAAYVQSCLDQVVALPMLAHWRRSQRLHAEYSELCLRAQVARTHFARAWQQHLARTRMNERSALQ